MRRIDLVGVDEVGDGEMKMTWVDGTDQVLVINTGGAFSAVQGICSHEYFELDKGFLTNGTLTCALHLSRFDITSGEPLDRYTQKHFYTTLGMRSTTFRPPVARRARIAPTEAVGGPPLRGVVHDGPRAALAGEVHVLGGVVMEPLIRHGLREYLLHKQERVANSHRALARRREPGNGECSQSSDGEWVGVQPNPPLTYSRVRSATGEPKTRSASPYSTRSPRYMKATWSATRCACCRLWVTITIAISVRSETIVSSITWVEIGSSAEQGSSSSSTSGCTASERAMQSRFCWPPESARAG